MAIFFPSKFCSGLSSHAEAAVLILINDQEVTKRPAFLGYVSVQRTFFT